MLISNEWLKEYIDLDVSSKELGKMLTLSGTNVEGIFDPWENMRELKLGKVILTHPHQENEKLKCCEVDVGDKRLNLVTADLTVSENDMVVVAPEGSRIFGGKEVQKHEFHGTISEGMMCSLEELGMERKSKGVYTFKDDNAIPGTDAVEYFGLKDIVYDLEITPNRPDCLSHIGIARECHALTGRPFFKPKFMLNESERETSEDVEVKVVSSRCKRYVARIVRNLEVKESPLWLKKRLMAVGLGTVNNIVDVTNYVMLEYGQPIHAFDLDKVKTKKILVRNARDGESIKALNDEEYTLKSTDLVITDGKKPIAIAGVIGGEETEIDEDTKNVLIEVAYFDPVSIRKTSKSLGLTTDASYRFERGVDPDAAVEVANRVVFLLTELANGKVSKEAIDVYPEPIKPKKLTLRRSRCTLVLGKSLPIEEIVDKLNAIDIKVEEVNGNNIRVSVPTFRPDIAREVDLIEEVGRLHGYDDIPERMPFVLTNSGGISERQKRENKIRNIMLSLGFNEALTYSFTDPDEIKRWGEFGFRSIKEGVPINNPLSRDMSILRQSLVFNLVKSAEYNLKRQITDIKFFEVGNVFKISESRRITEREHLSGLMIGRIEPFDYSFKFRVDFLYLKGVVEMILERSGIKGVEFSHSTLPFLHIYRQSRIDKAGKYIGFLGQLNEDICKAYDIKEEVYVFELDVSTLSALKEKRVLYKVISPYPYIRRDISLLLSEKDKAGEAINVIKAVGGVLVEDIFCFDLYKGKNIPTGFTSVSFAIIYRAKDRTLTEEEVDSLFSETIEKLESTLNVKCRGV